MTLTESISENVTEKILHLLRSVSLFDHRVLQSVYIIFAIGPTVLQHFITQNFNPCRPQESGKQIFLEASGYINNNNMENMSNIFFSILSFSFLIFIILWYIIVNEINSKEHLTCLCCAGLQYLGHYSDKLCCTNEQ
jgi:hypothetical protein